MSDAELLEVRLCDLKLSIAGTELEARTQKLHRELAARGLQFRPHVWLSTEWFSPDGIPGFAIPFYLAHPRLKELEQRQMHEVEGGSPRSCMQLMRHESAHALDNAYVLHTREDWREAFGSFTSDYVTHYQPKPYSKRFVRHLELWYAQSHPAEDFAETFAVWLDPSSRWRSRYRGWAALHKLHYLDQLMSEIEGKKPARRSRDRIEPISELKQTLGDHYRQKRARYRLALRETYDRDLKRLFAEPGGGRRERNAASFLRKERAEIRKLVSRWTGEYQYAVDRVLGEIIQRTEELGLVVGSGAAHVKRDAMLLVATQTLKYLNRGHHHFPR
ncbi:MAG TPA: putative zinc-binding metallopeptidase [Polyangiaceae bacterium]|nr:putative zinc-binding metallopeptidase [Polyangiaceae bacterium]